MNDIYVKLEVESPQVDRTLAYGDEDMNDAGKEIGFGIYKKNKKNGDELIAYIPQQQIVRAFVEIVKLSSVMAMLSSGEHKGNSFDHLITTALMEMDSAVEFVDNSFEKKP